MNKQTLIASLALVVFLFAGFYIYSNNLNKHNNVDNNNVVNEVKEANNGVANKAMEKLNTITIQGYAFNPDKITVKKGATVTWTNRDSVEHNIIGDEGSTVPFENSPMLKMGETYEYVFTEPGLFTYHCGPHPQMTGQIEVID